jgi:hypothetical protein
VDHHDSSGKLSDAVYLTAPSWTQPPVPGPARLNFSNNGPTQRIGVARREAVGMHESPLFFELCSLHRARSAHFYIPFVSSASCTLTLTRKTSFFSLLCWFSRGFKPRARGPFSCAHTFHIAHQSHPTASGTGGARFDTSTQPSFLRPSQMERGTTSTRPTTNNEEYDTIITGRGATTLSSP